MAGKYGRRFSTASRTIVRRKPKTLMRRPRKFTRYVTPKRVPRPIFDRRSIVQKMTWTEQRQLTPAGGGYTTHHYRANGPYDPDSALGGGQPRHWNFVKQGWKKYVVLGSKIHVKFLPTTQQDTAIPGVFWLHRSNLAASPYDNLSDARSDGIRIVSTGPTEKSKSASATFSLKKVTGNRYASADPDYQALTSGLPTTQQYFHLTASAIGSDAPQSMFFLVTIEYIVKFFDNNPDDGDS